ELAAALAVALPRVELEAALDEDLAALLHVAVDGLPRAAPGLDVDEAGLLDLLVVVAADVGAVHGEAERHDGGAAGRGTALGVARKTPDEQDLVEVGHGNSSRGNGGRRGRVRATWRSGSARLDSPARRDEA